MNIPLLLSFAFWRNHPLSELWDLAAAHGHTITAIADSGAFTAERMGTPIHVGEYCEWLHENGGRFVHYPVLDVIGDPLETARNQKHMEDDGLAPLPVFHRGTDWSVLRDYCADYDYLALGGMVPDSSRAKDLMRWLVRCFEIGADTGTVFHGFGLTNVTALRSLPFYSADSNAWQQGHRFGNVPVYDDRTDAFLRPRCNTPEIWAVADTIRRLGHDPDKLAAPRDDGYDYKIVSAVGAQSYIAFRDRQRRRFGPIPLNGHEPGLHLYLASAIYSITLSMVTNVKG